MKQFLKAHKKGSESLKEYQVGLLFNMFIKNKYLYISNKTLILKSSRMKMLNGDGTFDMIKKIPVMILMVENLTAKQ